MSITVTLYRPVGPAELKLIEESGYRYFPPRLPEQPIFYPVCTIEYAREIAEKWNVGESQEIHQAGNRNHLEYWIPADELDEFNGHIVGTIRRARVVRRIVEQRRIGAVTSSLMQLDNSSRARKAT